MGPFIRNPRNRPEDAHENWLIRKIARSIIGEEVRDSQRRNHESSATKARKPPIMKGESQPSLFPLVNDRISIARPALDAIMPGQSNFP